MSQCIHQRKCPPFLLRAGFGVCRALMVWNEGFEHHINKAAWRIHTQPIAMVHETLGRLIHANEQGEKKMHLKSCRFLCGQPNGGSSLTFIKRLRWQLFDEGHCALVRRPAIFLKVAPDIRQWITSSISEEHALYNVWEYSGTVVPTHSIVPVFISRKMVQHVNVVFHLLFVDFQFSIRIAHHFQAPLIMVVLPDQSRYACCGLRVRRPRFWLRARNSSWYSALTSTACQASSWSSRSIRWCTPGGAPAGPWRGPGVQGAQDCGAARSALGRVAVRCLEGADAACIGQVCGLAVQGVAVFPIGMDGVGRVLQGFE